MYTSIKTFKILSALKKICSFNGDTQVFHTSPERIGSISEGQGPFSGCLFFSGSIYVMGASAPYIYLLDLDESEIIDRSDLEDPDTIQQISEMFNIEEDVAEDLMTGRTVLWDEEISSNIGEDDWWLQGLAGKAAFKEGYKACRDIDEQGTVYIVYMAGQEAELICLNDLVYENLIENQMELSEESIDISLDNLDLGYISPQGEFYQEILSRV